MVDADYNVWLIEVNTNPCIEEPNDYMRSIVPRMLGKKQHIISNKLDDAFKLTIDKLYVPTSKNYKAEDTKNVDHYEEFPVDGMSNDESIW